MFRQSSKVARDAVDLSRPSAAPACFRAQTMPSHKGRDAVFSIRDCICAMHSHAVAYEKRKRFCSSGSASGAGRGFDSNSPALPCSQGPGPRQVFPHPWLPRASPMHASARRRLQTAQCRAGFSNRMGMEYRGQSYSCGSGFKLTYLGSVMSVASRTW